MSDLEQELREQELIGLLQEASGRFQLKEDVQRWGALSKIAGDLVAMAKDRFEDNKPQLEAYVMGVLDSLTRMNAIDQFEWGSLQYAVLGILGIPSRRPRPMANG